jgi:phosphocarrier protein HPr
MSLEARETFAIINKLGLHARAATKLVQAASRFDAEIELQKDGHVANGKSVMGVLLLCGHQGSQVTVIARGPDAPEAVRAIGQLIAERFGEPS